MLLPQRLERIGDVASAFSAVLVRVQTNRARNGPQPDAIHDREQALARVAPVLRRGFRGAFRTSEQPRWCSACSRAYERAPCCRSMSARFPRVGARRVEPEVVVWKDGTRAIVLESDDLWCGLCRGAPPRFHSPTTCYCSRHARQVRPLGGRRALRRRMQRKVRGQTRACCRGCRSRGWRCDRGRWRHVGERRVDGRQLGERRSGG